MNKRPEARDIEFMHIALAKGRRALPGCLPNPPVGCVITSNDRIVASGFTQRPGSHHAEAMALSQLSSEPNALTAYVTLEPCSFTGRTPSCARALVAAGIKRVVVAMLDPDPRNSGAGIEILRQAGIEVNVGLLEMEARRDMGAFLYKIDAPARSSVVSASRHVCFGSSSQRCVNSHYSDITGNSVISVRPIVSSEWREYRDIRLRALRDSPDAFGSTYEAEVARSDGAWSARIAASTSSGIDRVLLAYNREVLCGLVWCKLSGAEPGTADVFQMWVDPGSRGLGAGRALLNEALAWAKSVDVRCVRLGVTAADSPAMRLYRAHGFSPVGGLEPLREGSRLMAQVMELDLRR